jgi:hypothetical protein
VLLLLLLLLPSCARACACSTGLVFLLQTNMWLYQALEAEEQALQQVSW